MVNHKLPVSLSAQMKCHTTWGKTHLDCNNTSCSWLSSHNWKGTEAQTLMNKTAALNFTTFFQFHTCKRHASNEKNWQQTKQKRKVGQQYYHRGSISHQFGCNTQDMDPKGGGDEVHAPQNLPTCFKTLGRGPVGTRPTSHRRHPDTPVCLQLSAISTISCNIYS